MEPEKIKMLREEIEVPEGIVSEFNEGELLMKKDNNEIRRKVNPFIEVKIDGNKLVLTSKRTRRTEKKIFGSINAHIKNMIKGLTKGFTYKLEIANVHFPMTVTHDKPNNQLIVKNFLGEKTDRKINLIEGVEVKTDKEIIELSSFDKEKAGQCAANIEKGTKVRNKDNIYY
jgi:large subunit ribosomal protein L6